MVTSRFIIDSVVGVALLVAAAYFWSDVNYFRAVSFGAGAIAIIAMADGICAHAFNHGTQWAEDHIVLPLAKTAFLIASLSFGRSKPPTIDELTDEIKNFKAKSEVLDAAFRELVEPVTRRT